MKTNQLGVLPPQDIEIEETILGALMLEREAMIIVSQILTVEDFYSQKHQEVFQSIVNLHSKSNPIDIRTVTHDLRTRGKIEMCGGAYEVASITTKVNSAANIEYHSTIVKELSMRRQLIREASTVLQDAYGTHIDIFELLERTQTRLLEIGHKDKSTQTLAELIPETIKEIEERKEKREENQTVGLATGLTSFDRRTGGLQKGDFIVIAARPGMGKTALVNTLIRNIGLDQRVPVGFLSMEMTNRQTAIREVANVSGVDVGKMLNGKIEDYEFDTIFHTMGKLVEGTVLLDDTPGLTPYEMKNKAYAWKIKHDIQLLMIDYIQIGGGDERDNAEARTAKISAACKSIAKELDIPVIGLSQLSRGVESRGGDKRPTLADLRSSGAIEQDADMVMFLYRPEYYSIREDAAGNSTAGKGEIILAKHRNGNVFSNWFNFSGGSMKWSDLDIHDEPSDELPF